VFHFYYSEYRFYKSIKVNSIRVVELKEVDFFS